MFDKKKSDDEEGVEGEKQIFGLNLLHGKLLKNHKYDIEKHELLFGFKISST